jgi:hypothetical protein
VKAGEDHDRLTFQEIENGKGKPPEERSANSSVNSGMRQWVSAYRHQSFIDGL